MGITLQVKLYSRADCNLCDEVQAELQVLKGEFPHQLEVIDVDSNPVFIQRYGQEVPVVVIGAYVLRAPITHQQLRLTLESARERDLQAESAWSWKSGTWSRADSFTYWFSKHYLAVFNLLVFIYVGLPFLAPILMKANAPRPANLIYRAYGLMCHQLAYRSFFLFGEQIVYPRSAAGVTSLLPYGTATGLGESNSPDDFLTARQYTGSSQMGYKVALCERDVAIYLGILGFGLVFSFTRRSMPVFPWYLWVLIGILPMGLDGGSQFISQFGLPWIPFHESTPFLRVLTGGLFGLSTAWFGYPMVEQTMSETSGFMKAKRQHLNSDDPSPRL